MNKLFACIFIGVGFLVVLVSASVVQGGEITIMAANTTSGTQQAYEDPGIRIFQGLRPDIVLIQEFNYESGTIRNLIDLAFGEEYYYYVEPGNEQIPNGIISKYPFISTGEWIDTYISNRDFAWAVIDIPGEIDLQVVSVHLKAGSGSDDKTKRYNQALLLRDYVQAQFDNNHYIVIGGDLNARPTSEPAMDVFNSFLDADDHRPVDQNGNSNTNASREKPYDWVMPNYLLDEVHATLVVGSSSYPQGLVFDSGVYTPLSEVSPVLYGDSHVTDMQHMAVMKAFEYGVSFPVAAAAAKKDDDDEWYDCAITTAAYGTPMAEEVKVLSTFRDEYLLTNKPGRTLVSAYERVSPPVADFIRDKESLKAITRSGLKSLIWITKKTRRQADR